MQQPSGTQPSRKSVTNPPPPADNVRLVLAALALRGASNVSSLLAASGAVGARESVTRAFSTQSLRTAIAPYVKAGWIVETAAGYECAYGVGPQVLRSFSPRALAELGARYRASTARSYYSAEFAREQLELDVRLGLAGGNDEWPVALEELLRTHERVEVTARVVQEPLQAAFEPAWFGSLPAKHQRLLAQLLLERCEAAALKLQRFEAFAAAAGGLVQAEPELQQCWARLQLLLAGAGAISEVLAEGLPASSGVAFLRLVVGGDFAGARAWLGGTFAGKRPSLLPGAAGVFQVLVLLRGEVAGDLDHAARLANAGARKGNPFRASFAVLKRLLAALGGARGNGFDLLAPRRSRFDDILLELVQGWCALWFEEHAAERPLKLVDARHVLRSLEKQGPTWLSEQYRDAIAALRSAIPKAAQTALRGMLGGDDSHAEETELGGGGAVRSAPGFVPMRSLFAQKPEWEGALIRLEGLALEGSESDAGGATERVSWRVGASYELEPYLQRATATGWTRGRRLAVKHLLPGAAQRNSLPAEDLRVADHARETVSQSYGYREVFHSLAPAAWEALVGHPRVFAGDSEMPAEVVRGTLQLVARAEGENFCLTLYPEGLSEAKNVRREGERFVVYSLGKAEQRMLGVIGRGIAVPVSQRERLLAAAARLAHIVPLQSTDQALTDALEGDARPCMRLTPRGAGLVAALVVQPLGEGGPSVPPGVGSPLILARLNGRTQQARRDLKVEAARAASVVLACPVLEGRQTAEHEWSLEEPEACLELLASLTGLNDEVRVEWPQGRALRLRSRLDRKSLRGSMTRSGAAFFLEASLSVDDELDVPLGELLRLVSEQRGRFVRLEQGDFVELSMELREQLSAIAAARSETAEHSEVALPLTALTALEGLTAGDSSVRLDAKVVEWRDEFARVFDGKPRTPRGLNAELRDYQLDGFRWLARLGELGFGACLADDMGLGKTVQLIALLLHRVRSGPALVVAPTSVVDNWLRELARFAPSLAARSYAGPDRAGLLDELGSRDVVVTGYATLQQDAAKLQAVTWGTVVLDEAQFIKNAGAQRTRAALGLRGAMRVAATGTPVENHPDDLYSLFQFVQPGLLGSQATFRRRFPLEEDSAAGREGRRGLRRLIQPFLLRRTKAQVLAELPPTTEIEHQVELNAEETALYEAVRRAALGKLEGRNDGKDRLAVLAELTRLRRLCCDARLVLPETRIESSKLKAFVELMRELVAAGHRALVFSQFVDVLKLAAAALDAESITYRYLDGSTPLKQRSAAVDAFQGGEGEAFLISLKAGGFGLNLTAADYVIHLDPWWNPAAEAQATDRAHRIGQQNPVTVYRLVAKGTIEERIVSLHRSKRELADSLLADSDQASRLSSADLRLLLEA